MARHLHIDPSEGLSATGLLQALESLAGVPLPATAPQDEGALRRALERLAGAGVSASPAIAGDLARLVRALGALSPAGITRSPFPLPKPGAGAPESLTALLAGETLAGKPAPLDPVAVAFLLAVATPGAAPPLRLLQTASTPEGAALYLGEADEGAEKLLLLEANLDDLSAELLATLPQACLDAGALDAWLTPALMKKGRPGHLLTALARPETGAAVERALFLHSSTLGVRRHAVERTALARSWVPVDTPWGAVRIKVGTLDGEAVNAAPEFADAEAVARGAGVSLKEVYRHALAAYASRASKPV